jgi:hypothetical protein
MRGPREDGARVWQHRICEITLFFFIFFIRERAILAGKWVGAVGAQSLQEDQDQLSVLSLLPASEMDTFAKSNGGVSNDSTDAADWLHPELSPF